VQNSTTDIARPITLQRAAKIPQFNDGEKRKLRSCGTVFIIGGLWSCQPDGAGLLAGDGSGPVASKIGVLVMKIILTGEFTRDAVVVAAGDRETKATQRRPYVGTLASDCGFPAACVARRL